MSVLLVLLLLSLNVNPELWFGLLRLLALEGSHDAIYLVHRQSRAQSHDTARQGVAWGPLGVQNL